MVHTLDVHINWDEIDENEPDNSSVEADNYCDVDIEDVNEEGEKDEGDGE